ncbi:MAG: hypothetical protein ACD_19C00217G0001 [uncultured bacterium]|nr:MAG: hypothetical protein ACD_19C00217G0001 [uncultured bacterium]
MKNKIISGLKIGIILQWLSLFFSYQKLPNAFEDINKPIATGGFPFKVFEYPVSPMGNNWPPSDMWPMFFANLAIWLVVGILIALIFGKKLENNKVFKTITLSAIILSIIGILYIMLKFD